MSKSLAGGGRELSSIPPNGKKPVYIYIYIYIYTCIYVYIFGKPCIYRVFSMYIYILLKLLNLLLKLNKSKRLNKSN